MDTEKKLSNLYFGHDGAAGAFTGLKAFEEAARKRYPDISRRAVRRFYAGLPLAQMHRVVPRPKLFREVMVTELGKTFCMDGLYLGGQFKSVGGSYAYTAIDVMSRKMTIRMTSALTGEQAVKALDQFTRDLHLRPGAKLWTDAGSDFRSRVFQAALQQHNFSHYFSNPANPSKVSILERQHRSIRNVAMRILRAGREEVVGGVGDHGNRRTMRQALLAAVRIHNASFSRALGMSPDEVNETTLPQVLIYQQRESAKKVDHFLQRRLEAGADIRTMTLPSEAKLSVGTRVRIQLRGTVSESAAKQGNSFAKSFANITHSSTVYVIVGIRPTSPIVSYEVAPEGAPDAKLPFSFTRNELVVVPE